MARQYGAVSQAPDGGGPANAGFGWHNPDFALNKVHWKVGDARKLARRFDFRSSSTERFASPRWPIGPPPPTSVTTSTPASCGVTMAARFLGGAGNGFISGNALYGDFTAVYKIGKWEIGPVAYFEVQTTADTGPGCTIPGNCGNLRTVDVGGLVGYDFGPVDIQAWVTQSVYRQDAIDGLIFWSRIGFKLWGPEAPKPLVAKN